MSYDRVRMNIDAWVERRNVAQALAVVQIYNLTDPTAVGLLQMHAPVEHEHDDDTCNACPSDENGLQDWPCFVVLQIAEIHGIDYPSGGWADDPDFDRFAPIAGYPTDIEDPSITEKENHHA